MITFQQLRSGSFDPAYLKDRHAMKRLASKHCHKPDNPMRKTEHVKSNWMGNHIDGDKRGNIGAHRRRK